MDSDNKIKLTIILGIIFTVLVLLGSTYAYFQWATANSQKTAVTFTVTRNFSCSASGGGNITEQEVKLAPSMCTNSLAVIKRQITTNVTNNSGGPIYMDLWLDIKNIASELSATSHFRYSLTDSASGCSAGNVISSGSFSGTDAITNNKLYILNNNLNQNSGSKTYWLYIWLDYTEENLNTMDKPFHFELGGECRQNSVETPNKPYLYNTGLIPVKLSDNGATVTSVSENDSTWYDYSQKKWANAVLVKENGVKTREENRVPNTVINESDILAYYVWIPRYKYAFPSTCAQLENPNESDYPECYGYYIIPKGRETLLNQYTEVIMTQYGLGETQARQLADSQINQYISENGELRVIQYYESQGFKWLSDEDKQLFANAMAGQVEGLDTPASVLQAYTYYITQGNGSDDTIQMMVDLVHQYNETETPKIIPAFDYDDGLKENSVLFGPRSILIEFEQGIPTKATGTATGTSYYTHPAFSFGTKELTGIWVGKFETSHETLSSSSTNNNLGCSSSSCTTYNGLRILPNVSSLRYNNVSNFFYASRAMETNGNSFGISLESTDTHMMKNSEWGAVAYLSHSKYGINAEIRINNNSNYTTGCGALNANDSSTSTCNNAYKNNAYRTVTTYPQSTTGNVTGIFDMSGGAHEYVMGIYNDANSYDNTDSSGFDSSTNPIPDVKYYDNYTFDSFESCTLATCAGHALNETISWYNDDSYFVNSSFLWFSRGGSYPYGSTSGAFNIITSNGNTFVSDSARLVLTADGS